MAKTWVSVTEPKGPMTGHRAFPSPLRAKSARQTPVICEDDGLYPAAADPCTAPISRNIETAVVSADDELA